jgi:formate dehydrogenase major subunit
MKLVDGKYQKISWEQAINEVGDKLLALKKESGPDAVFWVGSSKHNNEQAYLMRKFVSFWGTNNCDHQARICHSTTVAGVANTVGLRRDDQLVQRHAEHEVRDVHRQQRGRSAPGVDAAHAAREGDRREDDRRRSALHAHRGEGRRIRAHPLGQRHRFRVRHLYHIFKNGWEDKEYIRDRVYGMDKVKEDVMAKWTPDKVEEVCGVPEAQV